MGVRARAFRVAQLLGAEHDRVRVLVRQRRRLRHGPERKPVVGSRRVFISGLTGAEGAAIDPVSGAFIFATFGGNNDVVVVRGFAPVNPPIAAAEVPTTSAAMPAAIAVALGSLGLLALPSRR
jgi:hypothetical protein